MMVENDPKAARFLAVKIPASHVAFKGSISPI